MYAEFRLAETLLRKHARYKVGAYPPEIYCSLKWKKGMS